MNDLAKFNKLNISPSQAEHEITKAFAEYFKDKHTEALAKLCECDNDRDVAILQGKARAYKDMLIQIKTLDINHKEKKQNG